MANCLNSNSKAKWVVGVWAAMAKTVIGFHGSQEWAYMSLSWAEWAGHAAGAERAGVQPELQAGV
jgi:hypothetical protein